MAVLGMLPQQWTLQSTGSEQIKPLFGRGPIEPFRTSNRIIQAGSHSRRNVQLMTYSSSFSVNLSSTPVVSSKKNGLLKRYFYQPCPWFALLKSTLLAHTMHVYGYERDADKTKIKF